MGHAGPPGRPASRGWMPSDYSKDHGPHTRGRQLRFLRNNSVLTLKISDSNDILIDWKVKTGERKMIFDARAYSSEQA